MKTLLAVAAAAVLGLGTLAVAQPGGFAGDQAASGVRVRVGDRLLCFSSQEAGMTWTVDGERVTAEGPHGAHRFSLTAAGIQVEAGEVSYVVPEVTVLAGDRQVLRGWSVPAEDGAIMEPPPQQPQPPAQPGDADAVSVPPKPQPEKAAVGAPPAPAPRPSFRVQGKR